MRKIGGLCACLTRQHLLNCMAGAVVFIGEWNEARSE